MLFRHEYSVWKKSANKYARRFMVELKPEARFVLFLLHSEKEVHESIIMEIGWLMTEIFISQKFVMVTMELVIIRFKCSNLQFTT